MSYRRLEPPTPLKHVIDCVWLVEDSSTTPEVQKIIPDGYVEIIFHFGDPFKIKLQDRWSRQALSLFAPQITRHFYLQNTGRTEILGIKLLPTAAAHLLGVKMEYTSDTVVPLKALRNRALNRLEKEMRTESNMTARVTRLFQFFESLTDNLPNDHIVDTAVQHIFETHGLVSVKELCRKAGIGERHLEKSFHRVVGISPKLFARIVRFNYVFQVMEQKTADWADVVYRAGYYDQSHFIRNFKAFTGEDPSRYIFSESNLANFFLRKGK